MADTSEEYMLTTVDNPFNPFTEWDEWLAYDTRMGYNTPGLLDRIAINSDELSEPDQAVALQDAIEEICRENVLGIFRKVSRNSFSNS
jgi:hypothetical protein